MNYLQKYQFYLMPLLLLLLGGLASYHTLYFYTQVEGMWLSYAATLFLPIILYIEKPDKKSMRFGLLSLASLSLFMVLPSHLVLLFAFYCFAFFVVESHFGQLNKLAIFLLVLNSPIAYYLFKIFGFSIRLYLTQIAAFLLNLGGMDCHAQGNLLELNGNLFSVDPVCMGLNMLMTSMLGTLILISFYEKKHKISLSYFALMMCVLIALVFVVFANLMRIIGIVLTNAGPGTFLHEALGLGCMALFVLVPLYFCIPFVERNMPFGSKQIFLNTFRNTSIQINKKFLLCLFLLVGGMAYANYQYTLLHEDTMDAQTAEVSIDGYEKNLLTFSNGYKVVQYEAPHSFVYIKPQNPLRVTNHNPLVCWRGSGYAIQNENLLEVGDKKVFTAKLVSEDEELFTAWWYDNGHHKTTAHLDWRFRTLKGEEAFRMVNVSSPDFGMLYREVDFLLEENLFD